MLPPVAVVAWYRIQMRRAVAEVVRIIKPAALELAGEIGLHADAKKDWPKLRRKAAALEAAGAIVNKASLVVGKRVVGHSKAEFTRIGIKLRDAEPALGAVMDTFRRGNVDLIQSLIGDDLNRIEKLLGEGDGRRVESLAKDIEERFAVTEAKAELLARDQTLKLNADVTRVRHEAAGIEEYEWTGSLDERERPRHFELEGMRFRYDDPPVTNDDGDTNNPGEDYQCRCVAAPVLPELEDEDPAAEPEQADAAE